MRSRCCRSPLASRSRLRSPRGYVRICGKHQQCLNRAARTRKRCTSERAVTTTRAPVLSTGELVTKCFFASAKSPPYSMHFTLPSSRAPHSFETTSLACYTLPSTRPRHGRRSSPSWALRQCQSLKSLIVLSLIARSASSRLDDGLICLDDSTWPLRLQTVAVPPPPLCLKHAKARLSLLQIGVRWGF